jgi:hypothetical protein
MARTFDRRNPPRLSEVFSRCYRADDKADRYCRRRARAGLVRAPPRDRDWTLIRTLTDPVSCVSCVSWRYPVNAAETHETVHPESGMRYQSRDFRARSEFRSGILIDRRAGLTLIAFRLGLEPRPKLWSTHRSAPAASAGSGSGASSAERPRTSPTCGPCSGRVRNESGRTDPAATEEIGAAFRWNRTTTNSATRELRP